MLEINELWKLIDKGRSGKNIGASTGLPKLDKMIGGVQPNRYITISAASSVGKTALALFMLYRLLRDSTEKNPVYLLYFSLEIGADILLAKLMSLYCAEEFGIYLTTNQILSFEEPLDDISYEALGKAKTWLESISDNLEILDNGLNARSLYKATSEFAEKHGEVEVIDEKKRYIPSNSGQRLVAMVDHLALVRPEGGNTLKAEMDLCSSYMVTLKRRFQMTFFVLMQQNRDSSSMDRRKADLSEPGLNDIKETGAVGQDSDIVLQLFWPFREKLTSYRGYRILGDQGIGQGFRSIILSKNRYGIANQVISCAFYGSVGWWLELPKADDITDITKYKDEKGNIPCKIEDEEPAEEAADEFNIKTNIEFNF